MLVFINTFIKSFICWFLITTSTILLFDYAIKEESVLIFLCGVFGLIIILHELKHDIFTKPYIEWFSKNNKNKLRDEL